MHKYIFKFRTILMGLFLFIFCLGINSASSAPSLAASLAGRILLQVEENGEAWYVIPKEQKMVYMKDGAVAYQIMRELSLGITDANLAKIPVGIEARFNDQDTDGDGLSDRLEEGLGTNLNKADTDGDGFSDGQEIQSNYNPLNKNKLVYDQTLVNRLKGYILLQTEKQGQAWYLNPKDGKRYYMKDGAAAYNIMRFLSLGITNKNLSLIPKSSRVFNVGTSGGNSSNQGNQGNNNSTSTPPSTPPNTPPGGGGGGGGGSNPPTPNNDQDNDGYKTNGNSPLDCNDNNPSINPGATEICGNNIDEDCSGSDRQCVVPDYDVDNDGYDATQYGGTDCNDNNIDVNPGEVEIARNNIDDNCNGQTDELVIVPGDDTQSPTTPTNLAGTTSGTQVVLTWTASTDNIGVYQYDIERQISAITGYQNIASVNATTYTNIDLTPNGSYTYRVKARDLAGHSSGYSNIFTITVNAAPDTSAPSAPTNLAATAATNQISLTWSPSSDNIGVVQYHIEMSTSTSNFAQIAIVSNTSYTNINLNPNTTYYYRVRARDAALWYSPFSQVFSIATLAVVTPPSGSVSISGVSGTISQGQTVTVSGSGFGTKTQANPLVWDNFEDGIVGSSIRNTNPIIGPAWSVWTNGTDPAYSNITNRTNSTKNALFDFSGSTGYTKFLQYYTTVDSAYFTFWWRYNKTSAEWSANIKPWDEFGNGSSGICPSIYSGYGSPTYSDGYLRASVTDCGGGTGQQLNSDMLSWLSYDSPINEIQGQWVRMEMYVKQSSAPNVADGVYKMWVHKPDGEGITLDISSNNVITRNTMDEWYQWWLLGAYHTMDDRSPSATGQIFGDDVYFDSSQARIELGNASTWAASTHREIQIPASWSNGSLSFTVNPGTFTIGQTVYLYVVDSNGSFNANGYPVTISGISVVDQTAPTNPTNLSAIVSGTQSAFSWTASTDAVGVTGYQIWRSTTNGGPYNTQVATSNTNSYTQNSLTAGTYYYIVKAYDAAGNVSGNSNQVTVTINNSIVTTTNLIQNSWDFSSTAWDGDATGSNPWSPKTNFTFTSGQSDPFATNKAFKIALSTSNRGYQQRDSSPNLVLNYDNVIASLYVKYGNTSNIVFGLNDTTTNTEYEQIFTFSNGVPVYTSGTNDGTTVTSVGSGWYRITMRLALLSRGIKGNNFKGRVTPAGSSSTAGAYSYVTGFQLESGSSATTYVETPSGFSDQTAPTNPTNLSAIVSGTQSAFSWTASTDAVGVTGYQIWRSTTNGGPYNTQVATSNTNSYTQNSLTAGTYYYIVKAYDAAGNVSGNSNQVTVTIVNQVDGSAPTAPTNLNATVSGTQISLNWTASSDNVGVSQYRIETANGGSYSPAGTSNSTSYTVSGLLANTTYSCRVQAQDAAGNMSLYSNVATVTTGGTTPPSGSVSISSVNDNTISNGQSITISGSGFGSKVAVSGIVGPPVLWDNFEDGANGQLVPATATKWDRVRSDNTSGPRYYAGAIDASMGVRTGSGIVDGVVGGNTRVLIEDDEFRNLYLDYYIRAYKGQGLKQRSNKQVMIWSANAGISEDGPNTAFWQITQGGEEPPFAFSEYSCANEPFSITYANGWGVDEFTTARHVQIEYRRPSIMGVDNGYLRMWYDGVLVSEDASFGSYSCDPDRNYLDNLYIGHYQDVDSAVSPQWMWISCPGHARCDECPVGSSGCSVDNPDWQLARQDEFFYDNIYIDKSIARVEIGNASTYTASTRREIQVPSSWGNSIQITVNKGGFSSGQTAYLYVTDSSGNVNSSGYPITFN